MIKDRNIDPNASFPEQIVTLQVSSGASVTDIGIAAVIVPYRAKLESAKCYIAQLTDVDNSAKIHLLDDAVDLLADTDPGAAGDTITVDLTGKDDIAANSVIIAKVTTGAGDTINCTWTLVLRPYLGAAERAAKGLV